MSRKYSWEYSLGVMFAAAIAFGCWLWPSVVVLLLTIGAALLFLWPQRLLSRQWRGTGFYTNKPRVFTAVAANDGTLALALQQKGNLQIHVIAKADLSTNSVTNGAFDADPAWDATCKRLAYISLVDGCRQSLHVVDVESRSDTVIVEHDLISQPLWLPDGNGLLFLESHVDRPNESTICLADLATRTMVPIAESKYNRPQSWALLTDGETIAFTSDGDVWLQPIHNGLPRKLPIKLENPCMVATSPDGRFLSICDSPSRAEKSVYLLNIQTDESWMIFDDFMRYVLWSPTGDRLGIARKEATSVFSIPSAVESIGQLPENVVVDGVGVCWRSESSIVVMRPNMLDARSLEEVDIMTGSSITLYAC